MRTRERKKPTSMICHWQCHIVVSVFLRMIVSFIAPFLLKLIVELSRHYLYNLEAWERKWCMSLNLDKCNTMTVTRKGNKTIHKYKLHEHELERVNSTTYLGVELSENLTWNRHIAKTCNKATKTLPFLRRNVQGKGLAYKGLVRPTLE